MTHFFEMAQAHTMGLQKSNPRHLDGSGNMNWPIPTGTVPAGSLGRSAGVYSGLTASIAGDEQSPTTGFGNLLAQALERTNEMQLSTMRLSQQTITDPDSVNIHDVTIAMAEANLSLSMTKAIADRVIKAYREIVNTR